ncbi:MAG: cytidylate kinase-like family protein [Oscillospiraceae bacterium]|nr:cytidylate kinase-like family protein [Oscillospiraceae bacterium]
MQNYVITLARGFGSGGKRIGLALSKELGVPLYESQILAMASEQSGISKDKFVQVDERLRGGLLRKLKAAPNIDHITSPSDKDFVSDDNLYSIQAQVIRELAASESCVIIGKCANFVLRDLPNVISVYVEAPRAYCLRHVMETMGVTEEEAHRLITKTDKYRADYFHHYTGGRIWTDPVLYDLTLNVQRVGRDKAVSLIKHYAETKFSYNA